MSIKATPIYQAIIAASLILALVAISLMLPYWKSANAHKELLAFRSTLRVGMSIEDARYVFETGAFSTIEWQGAGPDHVLISTPVTFGAKNWVLWIRSDEGAIQSAIVRTCDDRREHPVGAPHDLIAN